MAVNEIYPGTIIEVNMGRKFMYRVVSVKKNCTCPDPMDWYEGRKERPTRPHYHLMLKQLSPIEPGMNIPANLNHIEYRDGRWQSIFERFNSESEFQVLYHLIKSK